MTAKITTAECCRRLGCDEPTLRALLLCGRLPYTRKHGRIQIRVADLDRYLEDVRADKPPGAPTDDD
jgi:excisionase family DNA binding protein